MFLSNPIWLWALTGLTIPVGVHLLSRKEGKVIYIGSVRHLRETSTQQFKGIRLNEIILLSLRCLLITLFVLLLSGLTFYKQGGTEALWVIVEKGLDNNADVKSQLEKFQQDGYELRLLSSGFPLLADSIKTSTSVSYRQLIDALSKKDISHAIVFSKNSIAGFAGLRSSLPQNITWIGVASEAPDFTLTSYASDKNTITRTGHTSSTETYFTTDIAQGLNDPDSQISPLRISVVSDSDHQYGKKIIEAALLALEQEYHMKIEITHTTPEQTDNKHDDWTIWLAAQSPLVNDSTKVINIQQGIEKDLLVQKSKNHWILTKPLNEETALNENLTLRLASIIIPYDRLLADRNDKRMISDSLAWNSSRSGMDSNRTATQSTDTYIAALFFIILLIERFFAYHKNQ